MSASVSGSRHCRGCGDLFSSPDPLRRYCDERCRNRAKQRRHYAISKRAGLYLEREQAALEWLRGCSHPDRFWIALDAITDPDGFREIVEDRLQRREVAA
jgi:hypothetical protein